MQYQIQATYTNVFDTYAGRRDETETEIVAELSSPTLLPADLRTFAEDVDLYDFASFALIQDHGDTIRELGKFRTGGYDAEERAHTESFKR